MGTTAGIYLAGLFKRMGITETIKPKVLWQKNGFQTEPSRWRKATAEIVLTQISELEAVKGVEVAGPLPPEPLQLVTTYCAAIFTASKAQETARAFIGRADGPGADVMRAGKRWGSTFRS